MIDQHSPIPGQLNDDTTTSNNDRNGQQACNNNNVNTNDQYSSDDYNTDNNNNNRRGPNFDSNPSFTSDEGMSPIIVDVPLQLLLSLTAFGHLQLEGTTVKGFSPDAVNVLKDLYGKKIVKIGDNMAVESAKDIFFILEEYSKIGERDALVRFHCLVPPNFQEMSAEQIIVDMTDKKRRMTVTNLQKSRQSILVAKLEFDENGNPKRSRAPRSVKFDRGEQVVAVEAFLGADLMQAPQRRLLAFIQRNCGFGAIFLFGLMVALIIVLVGHSSDQRRLLRAFHISPGDEDGVT